MADHAAKRAGQLVDQLEEVHADIGKLLAELATARSDELSSTPRFARRSFAVRRHLSPHRRLIVAGADWRR